MWERAFVIVHSGRLLPDRAKKGREYLVHSISCLSQIPALSRRITLYGERERKAEVDWYARRKGEVNCQNRDGIEDAGPGVVLPVFALFLNAKVIQPRLARGDGANVWVK